MKIFIELVSLAYFGKSVQAELKLLSVVFRHGDRAPDTAGMEKYPNDPYAKISFFPEGPGGLTNAGKRREYRLGQFLRKTYGDFLGPTYYEGAVNARSTFIERARMSLQLVLAALYPPEGAQIWNKDLNWQPIPTYFVPRLDDVLMFSLDCPRFLSAVERASMSPEFQKKLHKFQPLMKNLTIETGKPINSTMDMYYLYGDLSAVHAMKLELPDWAKGLVPHGELYDGALLHYELTGYNDQLRRLNGGMLLRKITDDMTAACNGSLSKPQKIFLYSGHEFNVVAVLQALGVFKPHVPRYSAAVVIELHEERGECFPRVRYYDGLMKYSTMSIHGNLSEFKDALKDRIATDDDVRSCDKRSVTDIAGTLENLPSSMIDPLLETIEKERLQRSDVHELLN